MVGLLEGVWLYGPGQADAGPGLVSPGQVGWEGMKEGSIGIVSH